MSVLRGTKSTADPSDFAGSAAQVGQFGLSEVCDPVLAFGDRVIERPPRTRCPRRRKRRFDAL